MGVLVHFDADGTWGDTHICDHLIEEHLAPHRVSWGRETPPPSLASSGAEVRVLDTEGLFYLRDGDGFIGLLCETGEWVALPAGARYFFDPGQEGHAGDDTPPGSLPPLGDFIDRMLELTGHAANEQEDRDEGG